MNTGEIIFLIVFLVLSFVVVFFSTKRQRKYSGDSDNTHLPFIDTYNHLSAPDDHHGHHSHDITQHHDQGTDNRGSDGDDSTDSSE